MSEKHLTEAAWKSLLGKQKLKDPGLGKLLAAYEKTPAEEYDERLEALDEIEKEIPVTLKDKSLKGNEDVEEYLEAMEKEVPKQRKVIEAEKADAEQEEEEDDEGGGKGVANPAVLQKKTLTMMGQVRQKAPDDKAPIEFMACLTKGQSAVLLVKNASGTTKALLQQIMPDAASPKWVKGACIWEENSYTFVVDQVSGGLGKKLQKALTRGCGKKQSVRVRGADGTVLDAETDADEDEGDEQEGGEGEGSGEKPPGEVTGDKKEEQEEGKEGEDEEKKEEPTAGQKPESKTISSDPKEQFTERFRTYRPSIDQIIKAKVPALNELISLVSEITKLAKGEKYDDAIYRFGRLEEVIELGLSQLRPPEEKDPAEAFKERLTALLPQIKEAIAAGGPEAQDLKLKTSEAGTYGRKGEYVAANRLLDEVEDLLGNNEEEEQEEEGSEEQTPEQQYEAEFARLEKKYLKAVKGGVLPPEAEGLVSRLKTIWAYATEQAGKGAHPKALDAFKRIKDEDLFKKIAAARGEELEEEEEEEEQPEEEKEEPKSEAEQYEETFAAMEKDYLQAVKGGVLPPAAEALVSRLKTIWAFASGQAEGGAYAKALAAFKRITDEDLFAKIAEAKGGDETAEEEEEAPEQEEEQEEPATPQTQYERTFTEMEVDYLAAVKGGALAPAVEALVSRLKTIWNFASGQAESGAYEKALAAFKRIKDEDLFAKIADAKAENPAAGIGQSGLDLRKFLVTRWQQIPAELEGHIGKLEAALKKEAPHRDGTGLITSVRGYLGDLVSSLQSEINDTISGKPDPNALKAVRNRLATDEVLTRLQETPYMAGGAFREAILQALDEVEAKFAA